MFCVFGMSYDKVEIVPILRIGDKRALVYFDVFVVVRRGYVSIALLGKSHLVETCPFQRLLVCNPALRLSAEEAMAHPYFNDLNPAIKNDRCQ